MALLWTRSIQVRRPSHPSQGCRKANGPRGDGNPSSGADAHLHKERTPHPPESPSPIDQLVAALCDAGFNTNPRHQRHHRLDPDPDSDGDGRKPKVKIPPPFLKDYQVKGLMHTC